MGMLQTRDNDACVLKYLFLKLKYDWQRFCKVEMAKKNAAI